MLPNYKISNYGRIISYVIHKNGKLMGRPKDENGYYRNCFISIYGKKLFLIHRLVAMAFIKNPDGKQQVNHKDGNKINNYYKNLEWATQTENMRHAFKNKLFKDRSGENSKTAKLNWKIVKKIRNSSLSNSQLSIIYNVTPTAIQSVRTHKNWK